MFPGKLVFATKEWKYNFNSKIWDSSSTANIPNFEQMKTVDNIKIIIIFDRIL